MSSREAQLAALARRAQWLLDQVAFDLPEGRCSSAEREAVAGTLDELAAALRAEPAHDVIETTAVPSTVAGAGPELASSQLPHRGSLHEC